MSKTFYAASLLVDGHDLHLASDAFGCPVFCPRRIGQTFLFSDEKQAKLVAQEEMENDGYYGRLCVYKIETDE